MPAPSPREPLSYLPLCGESALDTARILCYSGVRDTVSEGATYGPPYIVSSMGGVFHITDNKRLNGIPFSLLDFSHSANHTHT